MHTAIVHLAPVFAAEKSKTPFYVAGGVLVAWALLLSVGIGRSASFPGNAATQRVVMLISAVLVLVTASMAVATSGGSSDKSTAQAETQTQTGASQTGASQTGAGQPSSPQAPAGAQPPSSVPKPPATRPAKPQSTTLQEAADPGGQLSFTVKTLSAKAGKVTIDFANQSPLAHNLAIAQGSKVLGTTPTFQGASKALTLNLKPGTYTFFCTVPGHRAAGMEGTLRVQ